MISWDSFPCWVLPGLFPFVSSFLSPPCPSLLPSLLSFFHLISGLSKKLGTLQAKSFFLLYFFPFVFNCDTYEMRIDFFFWNFLLRKKFFFKFFKEKRLVELFFYLLKITTNLCLEVGTHLGQKSTFSCLLQPYFHLWNSKN